MFKGYIDGWLPRFSLFVPIFGYLILFSDGVSEHLKFTNLVEQSSYYIGLNGSQRLRLIYFGLIFLGAANLLYRIRRPKSLLLGEDTMEYVKNCFENFSYIDYEDINARIYDKENRIIYNQKYDDSWMRFTDHAQEIQNGRSTWDEIKAKHGSFMRGLLKSDFKAYDRRYKKSLLTCIILSTLGYVLLAVPSIDLFTKVLLTTF